MAAAFILLPTVAVAQTQGSIMFVVDENLAPIEKSNKTVTGDGSCDHFSVE